MPSTSAKYAGTGANFNDGGNVAWTNPTNAQGDTTTTAATCAPASNGNTSQRLRLTSFGFAAGDIPAAATITGVQVEVERQANSTNRGGWVTNGVQLMKAGADAGSVGASTANWSNTKTMDSWGGDGELFGISLSRADVLDSGFGVSCKFIRNSNAVTASIFRARITVFYVVIAQGGALSSGAAASTVIVSANTAHASSGLAASAVASTTITGAGFDPPAEPGQSQGGPLASSAAVDTSITSAGAAHRAGPLASIARSSTTITGANAAHSVGFLESSAATSNAVAAAHAAHPGGPLSSVARAAATIEAAHSAHRAGPAASAAAATTAIAGAYAAHQAGPLSSTAAASTTVAGGEYRDAATDAQQGGPLASSAAVGTSITSAGAAHRSGPLASSARPSTTIAGALPAARGGALSSNATVATAIAYAQALEGTDQTPPGRLVMRLRRSEPSATMTSTPTRAELARTSRHLTTLRSPLTTTLRRRQ